VGSAFSVDWVAQQAHGLPGRLGLACAPGLSRDGQSEGGARVEEDLRAMVQVHGAAVLVTLLEETEIEHRLAPDFRERVLRAGLELISFPVADGWVPSSVEAVSSLIARILHRMRSGRTVVVHCMAGLGRTGTVAACCLVARGRSPAEAIQIVRCARPGSIQNPAQEAFVTEFASTFEEGACS
jgi:protein-tyrosine phosphatase